MRDINIVGHGQHDSEQPHDIVETKTNEETAGPSMGSFLPQPPTPIVAQPSPITTVPSKKSRPAFWRRSFAYLPEYLILLITLAITLSSITSLIGVGVDSLVKSEDTSSSSDYSAYSSYGENFSSFELVASLSALVVALPIFLLLLIRTKSVEAVTPEVKTHRWRKGFLGVFLAVQGLAFIWTLSSMAYDLIGRAVGGDGGIFSFFTGAADPWWQVVLVSLINALLILYVVIVVSRDYRGKTEA